MLSGLVSPKSIGLSDPKGVAKSQWAPDATGFGFANKLAAVNTHFDQLMAGYKDFNTVGYKAPQTQDNQNVNDVKAISDMFISLAIAASNVLVMGIDETAMSSVLSNVINAQTDPGLADYNQDQNRIIYSVYAYDPITNTAQGIGFIYLYWNLTIINYQRKDKDGGNTHDTTITMNARSALYSDPDILNSQYAWLQANNKSLYQLLRGFPPANQFQVFESLPPTPNEDVWNAALLLDNGSSTKLTSIVFYAADLTPLGILDNKASSASSTYSISTTSGTFFPFYFYFISLYFYLI